MAYRVPKAGNQPKRRIRNRPEQSLQIAVMQYLALALRTNALAFHIPNAARRGVVEGAMMKRMGTLAGMPDICILFDGRAFFLELKAAGKYVTPTQRDMHGLLRAVGCEVGTARSVDDVISFLTGWNLLRASAFRRVAA